MENKKELNRFLKMAEQAARKVGRFLSKENSLLRKAIFEDGRDVKIQGDLESEKIIIDFLSRETDFSILSEEKGLVSRQNKELTWIVDPVDGSLNYSRALPLCCVSVGLWEKDKPLLGVIYDFYRNEIFTGIAGQGAWLNGAPMAVSRINEKAKGVLCTGFPVKTDFSKEKIADFLEHVCTFKKIRLLGTAALSIAYVASGRAEGYFEKDIMLWDVAAGIPILLGAGGKIQVLEKAAHQYSFNVYLTNGSIH